jgi:hypothetical protein
MNPTIPFVNTASSGKDSIAGSIGQNSIAPDNFSSRSVASPVVL